MKIVRLILLLLIVAIIVLPLSAGATAEQGTQELRKPIIAVSILPHRYFVQEIGKDLVESMVLVGPGQNPHLYEPTPRQMADLGKASVWILSNTDFEIRLVPKIRSLYPNLLIIDGTEGVEFRVMEQEHEHEQEEEHHGDGTYDKHTWLGEDESKIFANHVLQVLVAIDHANAESYRTHHERLVSSIDSLFQELRRELSSLKGKTIFVYHPSFGYLFDDLGIVQEAVETGGKEPTPKTLSALIEQAQADKAAAIFVQAQFPTAAADTVAAAIGARVIPLDPLSPDWLENIRNIGKALADIQR